ncbi:MAG: glycosyltransferase [Acutalibacteraceae bacterium]
MRIGLLITSIGNFGSKGFYNAQEFGLAKALDKIVDEVKVYKLVSAEQEKREEKIEGCRNASVSFIPSESLGINGRLNVKILDTTLDALIYFSDTQFAVPKAYRWAKKNNVRFFPYIGVVESHSTSRIKKLSVDFMFNRNVAVYHRCTCLAKTPTVREQLMSLGVKNAVVTPVGLDTDLLKKDYEKYSPVELKKKFGYNENDRVLLFIGRLIDEKNPLAMLEILSEIRKKNKEYKLLMVGTGEMKTAVENKIKQLNLQEYVQMIDRIPNSDIWELYRFADAFVNLNRQEIFGMAILEAMYYGCRVVAQKAPGPDFIIENGRSGWLVDSSQEAVEIITEVAPTALNSHDRIIKEFLWDSTANKIFSLIRGAVI